MTNEKKKLEDEAAEQVSGGAAEPFLSAGTADSAFRESAEAANAAQLLRRGSNAAVININGAKDST